MTYKKILVAWEGSEYSNKAFDAALELAAIYKGEIFVVAVIQYPEPIAAVNSDMFVEQATNYYKQAFVELNNRAKSQQVNVSLEILTGPPSDAVVKFSETNNIDLIVIGARTARSFLNKLLLGSVSRQVVDYANCSVLVVRP